MMKKIIYLDNAATTRIDRRVIKEMEKFYFEEYGNPSSVHLLGERTAIAMNRAREKIAEEIGAGVREIIFTSGTTESNNMAFFGLVRGELAGKKKKIIISAIEHPSIIEICSVLKKEGFEICEIGVNSEGILDIDKLEREINEHTLLVSIIHVNNEIGVIQDIRRIGEVCRQRGVLFHSDCAQSFGKMKIDVREMKIDFVSAGAHKICGPKGIGFLYAKEGIEIKPLIYGGGQERGLRGGTENVPGITGFASALEIEKKRNKEKIEKMRDYFISGLEKIGGKINGSKEKRIYDNVNVSFSGIDAENLVLFLSGRKIMCSTGSACESKKKKENRVLKALGLSKKEILGSLRFCLSEETKREDIDFTLAGIADFLKFARK